MDLEVTYQHQKNYIEVQCFKQYQKLEELYHKKDRSKEDNIYIYDQFQQVKFFKDYASRSKVEEINQIILKGKLKKFSKDHCIVELDIKSEYFHIILSGLVGFYIPKPKKGKEEKQQRQFTKLEKQRDSLFLVKVFKKGETFGEISLIYDRGSDGSMYCMEETYCLLLNKKDFIEIIGDQERNSIAKEVEFLQQHPLFENWSFNLLRLLYFFSQIVNYNKNEVVYLQDTEPTHIYIVKKGEFAIYRNFKDQPRNAQKKKEGDDNDTEEDRSNDNIELNEPKDELKIKFEKSKKYKLAVMGEGEIFGEEDILMKQNRTFSVVCDSYNGAQLIKIKKKVFKLSIMADVGSSTFIKQRLKKKNYNHQLRLESINTFLKDYKEFFNEGNNNEKKQNQNEYNNNNQSSNNNTVNSTQVIQIRQDLIKQQQKRNSAEQTSNYTPVHYQGFLSPASSQFSQDKNNTNLNFSNSQNVRKSSFNSSIQQKDTLDKMKDHQDLFDHFSQFEKKIYKSERNKISNNKTNLNNSFKGNSPQEQQNDSGKKQSIKLPNQNFSKQAGLQLHEGISKIFENNIANSNNINSGRDNAYKININSLVTPKNINTHQKTESMFGSSHSLTSQFQHRQSAQLGNKLPFNELIKKSSKDSFDSLNSNFSAQNSQVNKTNLHKKQKSMSTQQLSVSPEVNNMIQSRRLSNFYNQNQLNQNNFIFRSQSPSSTDSPPANEIYQTIEPNQSPKIISANLRGISQSMQIIQKPHYEEQKNTEDNQEDIQSSSQQKIIQQLNAFNQPNQFYNLQGSADDIYNNSQQIEYNLEDQGDQQPFLFKPTTSVINPNPQKIMQPSTKFVMADSSSLSPNKYPINLMALKNTNQGAQSEFSISQIHQQSQQYQFINSSITDQNKNAKKLHLQNLLNKQKPKSAKGNGLYSSISASMPSASAQSCVQICTFPKETLEFNYSTNTNTFANLSANNYYSANQKSQVQTNQFNINSHLHSPIQVPLKEEQHLQQQYQQQQQQQKTSNEIEKINLNSKEENKQKKKIKGFRNSIFTENFQKTFQQNLHQIQFRILQKKHKVKEIQQSIAKHIQDTTIKHFLEENSLVKSKYEHIKQKQKAVQPVKSEPQLIALKQMLKNNLHYSTEEIEQGLSQKNKQKYQTANNQHRKLVQIEQLNIHNSDEEGLQKDNIIYQQQSQQNDNQKPSPNKRPFFDRPRSSLTGNYNNSNRQQYKFQQQKELQQNSKSNLVLEVKLQDEKEIKNFSITPNDKTGTVHVKSLHSLTCLPQQIQQGQGNYFNFSQKIPNSHEQRKESFNTKFNRSQNQEIQSKKMSLNENITFINNINNYNNNSLQNNNIKHKPKFLINQKIPQKINQQL